MSALKKGRATHQDTEPISFDFLPSGLTVRVSKRHTKYAIRLSLTSESELRVSLPRWVSRHGLKGLIYPYREWILTQFTKLRHTPRIQLAHGVRLSLLGQPVTLALKEGALAIVPPDSFYSNRATAYTTSSSTDILHITHPTPQLMHAVQRDFKAWLKQQFQPILSERVLIYASRMGLPHRSISIKFQKTVWGSCSSKKNLNFNGALFMMPLWVIDYVVVHELAHLKHMNHSSRFWQFVATYYHQTKEAKSYLKANRHLLTLLSNK